MNFPGPLTVSPVNMPAGQELNLRAFQRITAEVLQVSGTTAVLSIEGFPVVAQLTSADQAAALIAQRNAQFIVTQLSNQSVTLKSVKNDASPGGVSIRASLDWARPDRAPVGAERDCGDDRQPGGCPRGA